MIEVIKMKKTFGDIEAIQDVSATIKEGAVFGLVGTNGAGKSTFLRMIAGVLKPEEGQVTVDGEEVFENEVAKSKLFFISDEQYFFPNATPKDMMEYYAIIYPNFEKKKFEEYIEKFGLTMKRKISTFSKGMRRQVSVILGVCANTKYLLCDETFDGLDPVMRQAIKSIFVSEIIKRDFTPIVASHNLRELEDICDHVGLLHKGGILLSRDLDDMKSDIYKVQCAFENPVDEEILLKELDVLVYSKSGSLLTVTARGNSMEIEERISRRNPIFKEVLPLTLEEIFINETEAEGYDIKKLIV